MFEAAPYFVAARRVNFQNVDTSDAIDLDGRVICGIEFATPAAGDVEIHTAGTIDGTYRRLDLGSVITIANNTVVPINPAFTAGAQFVKVVSTVAQNGDDQVFLRIRPAQ